MGDIGILSGSKPKRSSTGVRVGPGCSTVTCTPLLGQLDVQAGAEARHIGLGRRGVRQVGHAVHRPQRRDQQDAAAAAPRESFTEVVARPRWAAVLSRRIARCACRSESRKGPGRAAPAFDTSSPTSMSWWPR